jgi:hypothetical protein
MSEGQSEKQEATCDLQKARSKKQKARSNKVACWWLALLAIVQSEHRLFTATNSYVAPQQGTPVCLMSTLQRLNILVPAPSATATIGSGTVLN